MYATGNAAFRPKWIKIAVLLLCCSLGTASDPPHFDSRNRVPVPYVVPSTEQWDGNDGPWSTFAIQIGTLPQTVKVQTSTSGSQVMAITPEGCASSDPLDCEKLRGEFFDYNASSTYSPNLVNVSIPIYCLGLEANLGYTGRGRFGFDDIILGWQGSGGPVVRNQTVAGMATKDFYIGLFGLTSRATNFTNYDNPFPSVMQSLRNQTLISSLSWAYTAGNQYRLDKVYGSLTLGGYDLSKFIPNNVTFPISEIDKLNLQIQRITTNNSVSLLSTPIHTTLDSTIPHIWLPNSTCALFESAFGLVWNETSRLYLLNDTQHQTLRAQNPTITFTVSPVGSSSVVNTELPYSAFDLTVSAPITSTATWYFPLRRANYDTQYVIGRTFFQEAYITADYERKNFSVSQCDWTPNQAQRIVTILPSSNTTEVSSYTRNKVSKAIISGAATGGVLFIIITYILLQFYCLKPRRKRQKALAELSNLGSINPTADPGFLKPELHGPWRCPVK